MALQLILGGSGSGKSTYVFEHIIERSIKEEKKQFLIIVPDQFTMETQMELVKRHPRGGILNIDVLSFSRLAYRIFEETGAGTEVVLDDIGKSLVLNGYHIVGYSVSFENLSCGSFGCGTVFSDSNGFSCKILDRFNIA